MVENLKYNFNGEILENGSPIEGGESKPSYVGYKFKNDITDPSQVHILFTVDEGDEAAQYSVDEPKQETNGSHTVITRLGYVNGRPALFNPDPEDGGEDCWYLYSGTMELDGTVYDKWFAPCSEYSTESGIHVYYRLSNVVVNPETIEDHPAPSGGYITYKHSIKMDYQGNENRYHIAFTFYDYNSEHNLDSLKELTGWDNTIFMDINCSIIDTDGGTDCIRPGLIRNMYVNSDTLYAYISDSTGSNEYTITSVSDDYVALSDMIPE